jgi:hypothetical protein
MNKVILTIVLSSLLFACGSAKLTEEQRMQNEIRRDVPFQLDSLKSINNDCWSFASNGIITVEPDYEIRAVYGFIIHSLMNRSRRSSPI